MSESFIRETLADLRSRAVTPENADLLSTAATLVILLGSAWSKQEKLIAEVGLARSRAAQVVNVASIVIDGIELLGHHSQHDVDVLKEVIGWDSSPQSKV